MVDLKSLIDPDHVRQRYARGNLYDAKTEIGYQAKRNGVSAILRNVAEMGSRLLEGSADAVGTFVSESLGSFFQFFLGEEIARNLGIFAGTLTKGIAGIASIGAAAGISAGFSQMDHIHQKENLRDLYADELGARLGKAPGAVTVKDMEALAKENPVLDEELKRARKQRNFAVPLAMVATLATVAVTTLLLPPLGGVSGFLMKLPVSMASYLVVKLPLQALGNKVFGLSDETPNDRIVDIKRAHERGITVRAEDIVPVFAQANPQIDKLIVQQFGDHYDLLSVEKQSEATKRLSATLPLETLTRDINDGTIRATELMFAVVGQASGVARNPLPETGAEVALNAPAQGKLFQEKLGLTKRDPNLSFTDRVAMEAAAEAITL